MSDGRATSPNKTLLRHEWFGGFEYCWKNNYIGELGDPAFREKASQVVEGTVLITPESPRYFPFPVRMNLDLTYFCNRECSYCHSDSGPFRYDAIGQELTAQEFCRILADCKKMGVFEVALTGGEPLLKPGIWQILDFTGALENVFTNLITNGTCISPRVAERLRKCGVDKVNISLDGFGKANDFHRWRGAYAEAAAAIEILVQSGVGVGVISVITKHNLEGFEEFAYAIQEMGVRSHNVSTLCDIGRASSNWMGISHDEFVSFARRMARLQKRMNSDDYVFTFNDSLLSLGRTPTSLPIYAFNDAVPGWKCTVKAQGTVIYDRVWGRAIRLGNVRAKSLYEIWIDTEERRASHPRGVYPRIQANEMLDTYARLKSSRSSRWRMKSALDDYYAG